MQKFEEGIIKNIVKPHLLRCRAGDWNHAQRVVHWVKKIGKSEKRLPLLIIAAYIHDIGWRDLVPNKKLSFEELLELEKKANANSEPYITEILTEIGCKEHKDTIIKLVAAADAHESKTHEEAIIVDADNLSKLDINHLKEKFLPPEWMSIYNLWEKEFPKRIKTDLGKEHHKKLLSRLKYSILSKNIKNN